ncbi:MAG TPA: AI-2E family transporter, partial [Vicinamibacterales bacterium]|nr:AI-2E family transporter [Vicinamibacterales bacterium]
MRAPSAAKAVDHAQQPPVSHLPSDEWRKIAVFALVGLFGLLLCAALWVAAAVFIPIALALLVSYALQPLHRLFRGAGLPAVLAAALSIAVTGIAIGGSAYAMRSQANAFVSRLPEVARRIRAELSGGSGGPSAVSQVEQAAHEFAGTTITAEPSPKPGVTRIQVEQTPFSVRQMIWRSTGGLFALAGQGLVVVVLTFYFLASGDLYKRKLVKIVGTRMAEKRLTVEILNDIERHVARYLAVRVLISAIVATATWLAFWALGMPEPAIWGIAAGVLNVIPYLGPISFTATATLVAFLQFDSISHALLVGAS